MKVFSGLFLCLSIMFTSLVFAEEGKQKFGVYFGPGLIMLDDKKAKKEGVEDSAPYLKPGFELYRSSWLFGGGLSIIFYDDNQEFKQAVEDFTGDTSVEESSAFATDIYAEVGYRHEFSDHLYLDVIGGYEYMLQSDRSISNCSNCFEEDIDLSAGLYLAPRLQLKKKNNLV